MKTLKSKRRIKDLGLKNKYIHYIKWSEKETKTLEFTEALYSDSILVLVLDWFTIHQHESYNGHTGI